MKKSTSNKTGKTGKQMNTPRLKAPDRHDDPQRRQPPTPQDIARVQPISQVTQKNHPRKLSEPKSPKGPNNL